MYIVSIFGSPHKEGISSSIHNSFIDPLVQAGVEIRRVNVYDKEIKPCTACSHCRKESNCIYHDDMDEIYDNLIHSRGIVISSPIYFSSLPGQLKNLIDRCQVLWEQNNRGENRIREKKGFLILSGGSQYKDMFQPSITIIRHFYNMLNCSFTKESYFTLPNVDMMSELPDDIKKLSRKMGEKFFKI